MGVACIWLAICVEKTYTSLVLGRAFLGLFEAPIEAIVPSTVTDIFFLHERGEKISIYGLGVLGGNEIGPLISAYIIQYCGAQTRGVRWAFFIIAISVFISQISLIFFMPETKFTGPRPQILLSGRTEEDEKQNHLETSKVETVEQVEKANASNSAVSVEIPTSKQSYLSSLAFCSGNDHNVSLIKAFLRPFVLMTYPTVLWSSLVYGLSLGWNVILGICVAQLFAPP